MSGAAPTPTPTPTPTPAPAPAPAPVTNLTSSGLSGPPLLSYLGADQHLSHNAGYAVGTSWATDTGQPSEVMMTYGPYTNQLAAGNYVARFALKIDNNTADDSVIVSLDINDSTNGTVIAREDITRREFSYPGNTTNFDVPFSVPNGAVLEFRVLYHSSAAVTHVQTSIFQGQPLTAVYYGNDSRLSHQLGAVTGSSWSASFAHGMLTYGPYLTGVPAGTYLAHFTLDIDDNSSDDAAIAQIDVNDAARMQVLTSRELYRKGFANPGTPTDFDLIFTAPAGASLEFRVYSHGNSYLQHVQTSVIQTQAQPVLLSGPVRAIFQLDGGDANLIVSNDDTAATENIARAIATLSPQYDVYAMIDPLMTNKQYVYDILDALVAQNMRFVLDVYSSSAGGPGTCQFAGASPPGYQNPVLGTMLEIPLSDLAYYKKRYGPYFAGIRMMEIVGVDNAYSSFAGNPSAPCWVKSIPYQPIYAVFNPAYLQQILQFARGNGMFVQISDGTWQTIRGPVNSNDATYMQDIANAIQMVGGANADVELTFDNNDWDYNEIYNVSTQTVDPALLGASDWNQWVSGLQAVSGLGPQTRMGLSDQSWVCYHPNEVWGGAVDCPIQNLTLWAATALANGVKLLQFEPAWYFFNLPLASWTAGNYTQDSTYAPSLRGQPTANFNQLRDSLLSPGVASH